MLVKVDHWLIDDIELTGRCGHDDEPFVVHPVRANGADFSIKRRQSVMVVLVARFRLMKNPSTPLQLNGTSVCPPNLKNLE